MDLAPDMILIQIDTVMDTVLVIRTRAPAVIRTRVTVTLALRVTETIIQALAVQVAIRTMVTVLVIRIMATEAPAVIPVPSRKMETLQRQPLLPLLTLQTR